MAKYSIIDVETTGTSVKGERITEIAIFNHDGQKITDEFVTLVNPEKKIPYRISQITGITDRMVENAPRFCEIARKVLELTEDSVFVAHNVGFDYGFVKEEFKNLGYRFERDKLCTVRLSRKLLPHHPSYSLGNICRDLGIQIFDRHRAGGDALATVKLFEYLLSIDPNLLKINLKGINSSISAATLHALPEEAGVYYFYDSSQQIIYIGKSKNIHNRVVSHLNSETTRKALEMKHAIADISYEITGSDLIAQLLESEEIKKHKPLYNRQQRRTGFRIGLFTYFDEKGYMRLKIDKLSDGLLPITTYNSVMSARRALFALCDEYHLCQKLCGLYKTKGACFQHGIGQCMGACIGLESTADYNARVEAAITPVKFEHENFFIIDRGRCPDEYSVVEVRHGAYLGFGYFDGNDFDGTADFLHSCIHRFSDTRDARHIILSCLKHHEFERLLVY